VVKGKALPDYACTMFLYIDMRLLSQDEMAWF
jgi:hypothetical protein